MIQRWLWWLVQRVAKCLAGVSVARSSPSRTMPASPCGGSQLTTSPEMCCCSPCRRCHRPRSPGCRSRRSRSALKSEEVSEEESKKESTEEVTARTHHSVVRDHAALDNERRRVSHDHTHAAHVADLQPIERLLTPLATTAEVSRDTEYAPPACA